MCLSQLLWLVLRQVVVLTGIGLMVGLPRSLAAGRLFPYLELDEIDSHFHLPRIVLNSLLMNLLLALSAAATLVSPAAVRTPSPARPAVPGDSLEIRFADRHFTPQTLTVPAGRRLVIRVVNASKETIEFESFKLDREVAMTPGETIVVHLPALKPGSYDFQDDFHRDVPKGTIVAK